LLQTNPDFSLQSYLGAIETEFEALGMRVSIREKKKTKQTNVDSAFLKSETLWSELVLQGVIPQTGLTTNPYLKIKLEVDTEPPFGFTTEEKLLLKPFSFYVKCFTASNLFAGKMHALLFRKWSNRVKGRDWYDMEWYIKKSIPLHLHHFLLRAQDSGDWTKESITESEFIDLIKSRIDHVSFEKIKEDIVRFIPNASVLDIWSPDYFKALANKVKFTKAMI
jgi:hypothetical protein